MLVLGSQATAIKEGAHRALQRAKHAVSEGVGTCPPMAAPNHIHAARVWMRPRILRPSSCPAGSTRLLSVEATDAMLANMREIRVANEFQDLEITLSDFAHGRGVVVSALGEGLATQAGLVVGDVLLEVNGHELTSHEQALATIRDIGCAELVFLLAGKARPLMIDKHEPGKLQITLANKPKGAGVLVVDLGLMGLAAAAGVRKGDTILSVNGVLVREHNEAIALMDSTQRWLQLVLGPSDDDSWDCTI